MGYAPLPITYKNNYLTYEKIYENIFLPGRQRSICIALGINGNYIYLLHCKMGIA